MYHIRIPKDINDKSDTTIRGINDGAFQISKGKMGSLATLRSQNIKAARWAIATMSKAYS